MANAVGKTWQLENRANLGLGFLLEILSIDCLQVVGSFLTDNLNWLKALVRVDLFFSEVFVISCIRIELVAIWID
jgi:hypothetical protein